MMRYSRKLKASSHCLPSPDGRLIATLFPSVLNIRLVETFEVVNVLKLPAELTVAGPVLRLQWSPSSRLVLVAVEDQIHAFSAHQEDGVHAVIRNPAPPAAKPSFIGFGSTDKEICMCSSFGLKFALFDIETSKSIEISNPKFFSAAAVCRGYGFRAGTRHMALLTRTAGKDMISVHHPTTREAQRAWGPDAIDAQGLIWSPDGRWLVVWDSPAQGHKVLFYTPDGQIFKRWAGPPPSRLHGGDAQLLGAGVKILQFSPDAKHLAIGDASRCICLFDMRSISEAMRLQHPTTIVPRDTLQIWQEQVTSSAAGRSLHTFVRASMPVSPLGTLSSESAESKSGCSHISFDAASGLLATRLDEAPGTVWIWDVLASELRAVLLFYGDVAGISWHPSVRETLLLRCEGSLYDDVVFAWDPLSEGPTPIDFGGHTTGAATTTTRKCHFMWLHSDNSSPTVFFSDGEECALATLGESDEGVAPWHESASNERLGDESPLELVPATARRANSEGRGCDEGSECDLEDTFHYKREGA